MFTEPESCECEGGQWQLGDRWWPVVTRLVTVTPEAKPDLAMDEEQPPPVESGAAPDLPPSYTEVVTSKDGLPAYATVCENI